MRIFEMSRKLINCPKCKRQFAANGPGIEAVTASGKDNAPGTVSRDFSATCTEHGLFFDWILGHHATMFKNQFPKSVRKKIKAKLSVADQRNFHLMIFGHRIPDFDVLRKWLQLASSK
jgi:hypothetical protein